MHIYQHLDARDQQGGFPRVRPFHCTEVGLTPAIIPNADNSGAQFLLTFSCPFCLHKSKYKNTPLARFSFLIGPFLILSLVVDFPYFCKLCGKDYQRKTCATCVFCAKRNRPFVRIVSTGPNKRRTLWRTCKHWGLGQEIIAFLP
jgi:hypothetical protein